MLLAFLSPITPKNILMKFDAIILDGNQRSALAITRSLGSKGAKLITADTSSNHLSASSCHSQVAEAYPDPAINTERFIDYLLALNEKYDIGLIIPATDITTNTLVMNQDKLKGKINVVLPFLDKYDELTDKYRLLELAESLGIPSPHSTLVTDNQFPVGFSQDGPVVIKPTRSKYYVNNGWLSTAVKIADSTEQAKSICANSLFSTPHIHPYMLQEFIDGEGQGVFAIYNHGTPVAFFCHRRIREKPPWGGVSVLSESAAPNENLIALSKKLLDHAQWHGVAMIEYKVSNDGTPYLMEINTRFWGSLQLAIDSGVDFPGLLLQISKGENPQKLDSYRLSNKLRWFLGDVDSLYIYLKDKRYSNQQKLSRLLQFFRPGFGSTRHEIFRWSDPKPALAELRTYIKALFSHS
jgi:predicted ATP-grasp superfamily ATP-dependent carboligase